MPTVSRIPKRSPIQVLTGVDVAWLPGADETGYVHRDMAVDDVGPSSTIWMQECPVSTV